MLLCWVCCFPGKRFRFRSMTSAIPITTASPSWPRRPVVRYASIEKANVPAIDHAAMDAANSTEGTEQTNHSIVHQQHIIPYVNCPASRE